jgi:hypothetical protein
MIQINRSRLGLQAALLLLAGAVAACADAPTGALISAGNQPAALNTAPTVTVTNSGGNPLISWGTLTGATSYTVAYNEYVTIIYKPSLETGVEENEWVLATTTGTSHLDTGHTYTGDSSCTAYGTYQTRIKQYRYRVTANYPDGTASTLVAAPVSPC